MVVAAMGNVMDQVNILGEATVANCKEVVAEYKATKIRADRYNSAECLLLRQLVKRIDDKEKCFGRELTDTEIDNERKDLVAKHKRVEEHIEATRVPFAELAAWITEEEEPWVDDDEEWHQKELTDDEIEKKRDELMAKYGVERYGVRHI